MSAFRTPNGVDDQTFAQLAAQALEDYGDHILKQLVDPKTGIIAESRFMPSIAEMRAFCQQRAISREVSRPDFLSLPPERSISKEERERVAKQFEETVRGLGRVAAVDTKAEPMPPPESPEFESVIREKMRGVQAAFEAADVERLMRKFGE